MNSSNIRYADFCASNYRTRERRGSEEDLGADMALCEATVLASLAVVKLAGMQVPCLKFVTVIEA